MLTPSRAKGKGSVTHRVTPRQPKPRKCLICQRRVTLADSVKRMTARDGSYSVVLHDRCFKG